MMETAVITRTGLIIMTLYIYISWVILMSLGTNLIVLINDKKNNNNNNVPINAKISQYSRVTFSFTIS